MVLISVVIPSYNPPPEHLEALYNSLVAQTMRDFEVIVVDDASEGADYSIFQDPRFQVLRRDWHSGPAACRNAGAAVAISDHLFFTDTDCELDPKTLQYAKFRLETRGICAGDTITKATTFFGKAVALLGFPGGGILGFDKVWRVDENRCTSSFSSCNVAMRWDVLSAAGGFDESFPVPGGEDTVLARYMADHGTKIRYESKQVVFHVEKRRLRDFIRWQITRGRGNYYIRGNVPEVGGYLRLRTWTFRNSLRAAGPIYALPVLMLIVLSVLFQLWGYRVEARKQGEYHGLE